MDIPVGAILLSVLSIVLNMVQLRREYVRNRREAAKQTVQLKTKEREHTAEIDKLREEATARERQRDDDFRANQLEVLKGLATQLSKNSDGIFERNKVQQDQTVAIQENKKTLEGVKGGLTRLVTLGDETAKAIAEHEAEVKPVRDAIVRQTEALATTASTLKEVAEQVKGLPAEVKDKIQPEIDKVLTQLEGIGQKIDTMQNEALNLKVSFEQTKGEILKVIGEALAVKPVDIAAPKPPNATAIAAATTETA